MSIVVKIDASIDGCRPEILVALITKIQPVFDVLGLDTVVTSGIEDYKHSAKRSRHYCGDAVDIRSKHITTNKHEVLGDLRNVLGKHYVVILEGLGKSYEHFHIHYAPQYDGSILTEV